MKLFNRLGLFLLVFALCLVPYTRAGTYDLSYDGTGINFVGSLVTKDTLVSYQTLNADGSLLAVLQGYQIISVTGKRNNVTINGLVIDLVSPDAVKSADGAVIFDNNLLDPPAFDIDGLFYDGGGSTSLFNLYLYNGNYFEYNLARDGAGASGQLVNVTITNTSAVPDTATTLWLLAGSLLALVAASKFINRKLLLGTLMAGSLVASSYAHAATIVKETGIGPNEIVSITSTGLGSIMVYAGLQDLTVNNVATYGFCIDPWHYSISNTNLYYDTVALSSAPYPGTNQMGNGAALQIERLWAKYYSPTMTNQDAAGMQIAIWEIVGGVNSGFTFTFNGTYDFGARDMIDYSKTVDAPVANLVGLTPVNGGQAYVVQSVPDGGTTLLLVGLGTLGLIAMGRRLT